MQFAPCRKGIATVITADGTRVANAIVMSGGLRSFLYFEKGGDLAPRLEALYDYMERTLLEGSARNDMAKLDEVIELLRSIKEGWDGIREEVVTQHSQAAG